VQVRASHLPHGGGYPATLDKQLLALLTSQVALQPDVTLYAARLKRRPVEVHLDCLSLQKLGLPRKVLRLRKSRSRPASLSSQSRPLGSSPFHLYRRNRLSSGDDQSLRACGARHKSQPERAAQSRGSDFDREFGFAWTARPPRLKVRLIQWSLILMSVMLWSRSCAPKTLLLDNLPVHQASQVEQAVTAVKAEVLWLPAYSPDFSPIENCWSKVKTLVRGRQPRTPKELNTALAAALCRDT
jgi:hypothetical protein